MSMIKRKPKTEPKIEKSVFEKMADIMAEQKKSIEQLTAAVEKQEKFFDDVEKRLDKLVETDKKVHDKVNDEPAPEAGDDTDKGDDLKDKIKEAETEK
jgi:uncharacterized coiled-coil protein SlyX